MPRALLVTAFLLGCLVLSFAWVAAQSDEDRFHHPRRQDSEICGRNILDGQEFLQPFYIPRATQILTLSVWASRIGITPTAHISVRSGPYTTTAPTIFAAESISVPTWSADPLRVAFPVRIAPGKYILAIRVAASKLANMQIDTDCLWGFDYPGYTKPPGFDEEFEHGPLFFAFDTEEWPEFTRRVYLPAIRGGLR